MYVYLWRLLSVGACESMRDDQRSRASIGNSPSILSELTVTFDAARSAIELDADDRLSVSDCSAGKRQHACAPEQSKIFHERSHSRLPGSVADHRRLAPATATKKSAMTSNTSLRDGKAVV